jgi:arylsulfatase A-like enzyme
MKRVKTNLRVNILMGMGVIILAGQLVAAAGTGGRKRPNILLAISDDQSWEHASAYGCKAVKTPAFDRVAAEGVLFTHFFASAPQCSPNRASLLTGRHIWQNREAGTHSSSFPADLAVYPELLEQRGYESGYTGKAWSPGNWKISGRTNNPSGKPFNDVKLNPEEVPASGISKTDYAGNFQAFLKQKDPDKPFCFWYGAYEPHRDYEKGSGVKAGKSLSDVQVPAFLPDNETVRSDFLDYMLEIEWFDKHLAKMMKILESRGELDDTLIIVTADNGMPFPRSKANLYEYGVRLPLAVRYPRSVPAGRRHNDLVSFVDIAPTILETAGVVVPAAMTGRSLLPLLKGETVKGPNDHALFGRERHTHARPDNVGYPSRAIRTEKYLYIWNMKPDRWPVGNPPGYEDTDGGSPTKTYLLEHQQEAEGKGFYELAFALRPADELYEVEKDPGCVTNLASQADYAKTVAELKAKLQEQLRQQGDPRVMGSEIFDSYPRYNSMRKALPGFKESGKYNPAFQDRPMSVERQNLSMDKIYEGFKTPPPEARPFVRWWWNNNQVEEKEILRELDVLKAAGIGGVEINPIAGKEKSSGSKAKILTWRSEEWDRMVQVACKGAKKRGMIVDLIAGSGWPFGGQFLKPDERIMRVKVITDTVKGPLTFRKTTADIFNSTYEGYHNDRVKFINPSLSFVSVYPKNLTSLEQVKDVTGLINKDGILQVDVGQGEYVVAYGVREQGFRTVFHGAKGADGPTMDHLNKNVTRAYLNRLKGIEDTWKEPLSNYVRAIFCDSIETDGANWTHDILESFKKEMGYDIKSYLPFVIGPEDASLASSPQMTDLLRRARYDWNKHVATVFLSNFTSEYAAFCHEHQLLSRYQAYGNPDLMAMPEGYMIPDIPESNNWLYQVDPYAEGRFTWFQEQGYMLWNKYAAAGGNLRGKKIVSSEAMTNSKKVFHGTLGSIKQADDMNFITGITHSVLHGYNYVPSDIPFPGWIRYGSFFSEYNTWWPYFSLWVNYNARLSYVFQETKAVNEIALLGPTPDIWSKTGLHREEFHLLPDYFHQLWEPIAQLGAGCDYLHEAVIQKAHVRDGQLICGQMAYQVLLVAEMDSMLPETAEAIQRFAEAGVSVIFVKTPPNRSPGLVNSEVNDKRVREAIKKMLKSEALFAPAPEPGSTSTALRNWLSQVLAEVTWKPGLKIQKPKDGVYATHRQVPGHEIFFFANTYRKESSTTRVAVKLENKGLWRWDPETGERTPYALPYDEEGFEIDLRPLESLLLVTGQKQDLKVAHTVYSDNKKTFRITTPWTVEFAPARSDARFTITMDTLSDFTSSKDVLVKTFSGTATYMTTFKLEDPSYAELDLGWDNDFISEVTLNGTKLGVNWYGSRRFDVGGIVKKGSNDLTIRYTTTLWNGMGKTPLQPSGLIGPVKLVRADRGVRE